MSFIAQPDSVIAAAPRESRRALIARLYGVERPA
jgi:hypothetical protein